MSHLIADPTALTLGFIVGAGGGLYAHRAAGRAVTGARGRSTESNAPRVELLVGLGAAVGLLVAARFGMSSSLPTYLYLVAIAPALGAIDATVLRLPNRLVLPSYPIAMALIGLAEWREDRPEAFLRALLAGAAVYVFLLVIALAAPSHSFGWGDVKLGGLLGLFLGYLGWLTTWLGMMAAFVLASAYVLSHMHVDSEQRARLVPLGPALLLGTLLAVVVS